MLLIYYPYPILISFFLFLISLILIITQFLLNPPSHQAATPQPIQHKVLT